MPLQTERIQTPQHISTCNSEMATSGGGTQYSADGHDHHDNQSVQPPNPAQLPHASAVAAAPTQAQAAIPAHKRVYQACIPCRRRKVRCNLGSVDEPHDPPCQRCRRESKDCYFSATRRKKRPADGGDDPLEDDGEDEYSARNGRKRVRRSSEVDGSPMNNPQTSPPSTSTSASHPALPGASSAHQPLTPGGSRGRPQPLRRPRSESLSSLSPHQPYSTDALRPQPYSAKVLTPTVGNTDGGDDDQHLTNRLWETEVYSGHDALNLLFEAAGRTGDIGHQRVGSQGSAHQSPVTTARTPVRPTSSRVKGPHGRTGEEKADMMGPPRSTAKSEAIPLGSSLQTQEQLSDPGGEGRLERAGLQDALKAWSRLRFVRAGWFTAREAIEYIDYFYTFMVPLTPVLPPTYHSPSTHSTLITEEPILTITLLTISSRYLPLSGPGGRSRSYAVHEKLWTYLRGMIERMVWGQEQFGGGGHGAAESYEGETQTSTTAPWRGLKKGSLRTLGTVESLMLLTEWHPRALHFPPGDDGDELVVKEEQWPFDDSNLSTDAMDSEGGIKSQKGIGGKRIENWLEPAWRSDRMCWMLLGNALALAFELGVFDPVPEVVSPGMETHRPDRESLSYRIRADRVKKLLYVYVTQLAGRLEWTSMMGSLPVFRNIRLSSEVSDDSSQNQPAETSRQYTDTAVAGDSIDDAILHCWIEITNLMKSGNERLFPNRKVTRDLIRSGRYVSLLESFAPRLRQWTEDFTKLSMPDYIRFVLEIEFEYVRVYINSLALQAVVERCTSNGSNMASNNPGSTSDPLTPGPRDRTGSIAFSSLMGPQDQEYIKEVVEASRNLLRTVVEGLLPGDYLKHCPVRTYFRIISGAMFLLKTFALGAKEEDVAISLGLMDSTVDALRNCIVDDVHLGIRFADLLDVLTKRIRSRFVRMAATTSGAGATEVRSPVPHHHPTPHQQSHGQENTTASTSWQSDYATPAADNGLGYTGRSTPNPLFGISTDAVDPDDGHVSIMPPPSYAFPSTFGNIDGSNGLALGGGGGGGTGAGGVPDDGSVSYPADWLGLDLNPLLNYGAGMAQSYGTGVSVGGFDLLEVLLNDMEGGAATGGM